jgi:hypothetical protein
MLLHIAMNNRDVNVSVRTAIQLCDACQVPLSDDTDIAVASTGSLMYVRSTLHVCPSTITASGKDAVHYYTRLQFLLNVNVLIAKAVFNTL